MPVIRIGIARSIAVTTRNQTERIILLPYTPMRKKPEVTIATKPRTHKVTDVEDSGISLSLRKVMAPAIIETGTINSMIAAPTRKERIRRYFMGANVMYTAKPAE